MITFRNLFWVSDKRIELGVTRIYAGDIDLKIQWYENIPGISGSYLVYIFYCDNPTQVQSHTQLVHGKMSMTQIYGAVESHTPARNKSLSP